MLAGEKLCERWACRSAPSCVRGGLSRLQDGRQAWPSTSSHTGRCQRNRLLPGAASRCLEECSFWALLHSFRTAGTTLCQYFEPTWPGSHDCVGQTGCHSAHLVHGCPQVGFGSGFKCNSMVWKALRPIRTAHSAWEISDIRNTEAAAAAAGTPQATPTAAAAAGVGILQLQSVAQQQTGQEAAPAAAKSSGAQPTANGAAPVANGYHQGLNGTGGQSVGSPLKNGTTLKGTNGRVPTNGSEKSKTAPSEEGVAQRLETEKQSHMQTPRNGQKLVADARG